MPAKGTKRPGGSLESLREGRGVRVDLLKLVRQRVGALMDDSRPTTEGCCVGEYGDA